MSNAVPINFRNKNCILKQSLFVVRLRELLVNESCRSRDPRPNVPSFSLDFPSRRGIRFRTRYLTEPASPQHLQHLAPIGPRRFLQDLQQPPEDLAVAFNFPPVIEKYKMSPIASRAVLRQSRFLIRRTAIRHNSSTPEAANKAKQTASKASEGLSKVSSTAGPAISGAAQNIGNALRKVGGPVGKVVTFVEGTIPTQKFQ